MRVGRNECSSSSALALALELVRATSTQVSVLVISCPDELVLFGMSTITRVLGLSASKSNGTRRLRLRLPLLLEVFIVHQAHFIEIQWNQPKSRPVCAQLLGYWALNLALGVAWT